MTSQARPAAICSWLSVSCIESSRSCRLVAGMHSTSFVLGKGVGCLRFVSCELVSNSDELLARAWCLLSDSFLVNSRHSTAAFTALPVTGMLVDRRDEEAAGKIAKNWRFRRRSQNKRKRILFTSDNGGGVRANLKTTVEVTIPVICVDLLQCMQLG